MLSLELIVSYTTGSLLTQPYNTMRQYLQSFSQMSNVSVSPFSHLLTIRTCYSITWDSGEVYLGIEPEVDDWVRTDRGLGQHHGDGQQRDGEESLGLVAQRLHDRGAGVREPTQQERSQLVITLTSHQSHHFLPWQQPGLSVCGPSWPESWTV